MKERKSHYDWIPLWVDKWLFGSTRIELDSAERAVWIDLIALASKDSGYIRANENLAYPFEQLAGMLCIPLELLQRTIEKCLSPTINKLQCLENNILIVVNWEKYCLSKRHQERFMSRKDDTMSRKDDTMSRKDDTYIYNNIKNKDIYSQIISFLNNKADTQYKPTTPKTIQLINARIKEGFSLEDFKKVIQIKVESWLNDEKMAKYLRPETLFSTKFESYLNEKKEKSNDDIGEMIVK